MASLEAPSKIQEAVQEVNDIVNEANNLLANCELVKEEIDKKLKQESKILEMQGIVDDISSLERASLYLELVKFIEDVR